MTLAPDLPFEFVIRGTALSLQASGRSRDAWKALVRQAARDALPEGCWLLTEALAVTIFIFPNAIRRGDIDNRVKPILDAMTQCVYSDDELVERVVVQKFEPGRIFPFQDPSERLAEALEADEPIVYIRITNDLHEGLA